MARKPTYEVLTWDMDKGRYGEWTPQQGVRRGPYSLMGLRRAMRKLQNIGYDTSRGGGVSILVQKR